MEDSWGRQQSETVAIVNLVTPGTIDAEVYDRCLSRIGVFQHANGGNEQILGDITKELHDIAESFSLSEEALAGDFVVGTLANMHGASIAACECERHSPSLPWNWRLLVV